MSSIYRCKLEAYFRPPGWDSDSDDTDYLIYIPERFIESCDISIDTPYEGRVANAEFFDTGFKSGYPYFASTSKVNLTVSDRFFNQIGWTALSVSTTWYNVNQGLYGWSITNPQDIPEAFRVKQADILGKYQYDLDNDWDRFGISPTAQNYINVHVNPSNANSRTFKDPRGTIILDFWYDYANVIKYWVQRYFFSFDEISMLYRGESYNHVQLKGQEMFRSFMNTIPSLETAFKKGITVQDVSAEIENILRRGTGGEKRFKIFVDDNAKDISIGTEVLSNKSLRDFVLDLEYKYGLEFTNDPRNPENIYVSAQTDRWRGNTVFFLGRGLFESAEITSENKTNTRLVQSRFFNGLETGNSVDNQAFGTTTRTVEQVVYTPGEALVLSNSSEVKDFPFDDAHGIYSKSADEVGYVGRYVDEVNRESFTWNNVSLNIGGWLEKRPDSTKTIHEIGVSSDKTKIVFNKFENSHSGFDSSESSTAMYPLFGGEQVTTPIKGNGGITIKTNKFLSICSQDKKKCKSYRLYERYYHLELTDGIENQTEITPDTKLGNISNVNSAAIDNMTKHLHGMFFIQSFQGIGEVFVNPFVAKYYALDEKKATNQEKAPSSEISPDKIKEVYEANVSPMIKATLEMIKSAENATGDYYRPEEGKTRPELNRISNGKFDQELANPQDFITKYKGHPVESFLKVNKLEPKQRISGAFGRYQFVPNTYMGRSYNDYDAVSRKYIDGVFAKRPDKKDWLTDGDIIKQGFTKIGLSNWTSYPMTPKLQDLAATMLIKHPIYGGSILEKMAKEGVKDEYILELTARLSQIWAGLSTSATTTTGSINIEGNKATRTGNQSVRDFRNAWDKFKPNPNGDPEVYESEIKKLYGHLVIGGGAGPYTKAAFEGLCHAEFKPATSAGIIGCAAVARTIINRYLYTRVNRKSDPQFGYVKISQPLTIDRFIFRDSTAQFQPAIKCNKWKDGYCVELASRDANPAGNARTGNYDIVQTSLKNKSSSIIDSVRQAIKLAFDLEEYLKEANELKGTPAITGNTDKMNEILTKTLFFRSVGQNNSSATSAKSALIDGLFINAQGSYHVHGALDGSVVSARNLDWSVDGSFTEELPSDEAQSIGSDSRLTDLAVSTTNSPLSDSTHRVNDGEKSFKFDGIQTISPKDIGPELSTEFMGVPRALLIQPGVTWLVFDGPEDLGSSDFEDHRLPIPRQFQDWIVTKVEYSWRGDLRVSLKAKKYPEIAAYNVLRDAEPGKPRQEYNEEIRKSLSLIYTGPRFKDLEGYNDDYFKYLRSFDDLCYPDIYNINPETGKPENSCNRNWKVAIDRNISEGDININVPTLDFGFNQQGDTGFSAEIKKDVRKIEGDLLILSKYKYKVGGAIGVKQWHHSPDVYPLKDGRSTIARTNAYHQLGNKTLTAFVVDFNLPTNSPNNNITAPFDGEVVWAREVDGFGNTISLHNKTLETWVLFGHLASDVSSSFPPGTKVRAGQVVGVQGSTGRSSGPHVHMEYITKDGKFQGVIDYLDSYITGTALVPGNAGIQSDAKKDWRKILGISKPPKINGIIIHDFGTESANPLPKNEAGFDSMPRCYDMMIMSNGKAYVGNSDVRKSRWATGLTTGVNGRYRGSRSLGGPAYTKKSTKIKFAPDGDAAYSRSPICKEWNDGKLQQVYNSDPKARAFVKGLDRKNGGNLNVCNINMQVPMSDKSIQTLADFMKFVGIGDPSHVYNHPGLYGEGPYPRPYLVVAHKQVNSDKQDPRFYIKNGGSGQTFGWLGNGGTIKEEALAEKYFYIKLLQYLRS